jgi:hypothetical protein
MPIFHSATDANISGGVFNDINGDQNNVHNYFMAESENGAESEAKA